MKMKFPLLPKVKKTMSNNKSNSGGKGSAQRPTDLAAYEEAWDRIFGSQLDVQENQDQDLDEMSDFWDFLDEQEREWLQMPGPQQP